MVRILRRARLVVADTSRPVPVTPTRPRQQESLYPSRQRPPREGDSVWTVFIFRNRTANRLKVLYWGGHGLCLWCQKQESEVDVALRALEAFEAEQAEGRRQRQMQMEQAEYEVEIARRATRKRTRRTGWWRPSWKRGGSRPCASASG